MKELLIFMVYTDSGTLVTAAKNTVLQYFGQVDRYVTCKLYLFRFSYRKRGGGGGGAVTFHVCFAAESFEYEKTAIAISEDRHVFAVGASLLGQCSCKTKPPVKNRLENFKTFKLIHGVCKFKFVYVPQVVFQMCVRASRERRPLYHGMSCCQASRLFRYRELSINHKQKLLCAGSFSLKESCCYMAYGTVPARRYEHLLKREGTIVHRNLRELESPL